MSSPQPRPSPDLPASQSLGGEPGPGKSDDSALTRYLAEPRPLPASGVDVNGRAIPISDEEQKARFDNLQRILAKIDADDETPNEVYEQLMRNLDEERKRVGRPPAFEGYY